jgi:hypothetical protein
MVYKIVFLIANTILGIFIAAEFFRLSGNVIVDPGLSPEENRELLDAFGAGFIIGAILYLCK